MSPYRETVVLTVAGQATSFRCPNCQRKISFQVAFPLDFRFRMCSGCRWVWTNVTGLSGFNGRHVEELDGTAHHVELAGLE